MYRGIPKSALKLQQTVPASTWFASSDFFAEATEGVNGVNGVRSRHWTIPSLLL